MTIASVLLLLLVIGAFSFFFTHAYRLATYIRAGKSIRGDYRLEKMSWRLKNVLIHVFGQGRMFKEWKPGIMHFMIFWGFIIITIGTSEILMEGIFPAFELESIIGHALYNAIALFQDSFNILVTLAILYALYRRIIVQPERLKNKLESRIDAYLILGLILYLMISNIGANSTEIALSIQRNSLPDSASFRPFSSFFAGWLHGSRTLEAQFHFWWWSHIIVVLGFLCYLPFSKHLHIVVALPNVFFASAKPKGKLKKLNLEDEAAESFGVGKVEDFTWKQLLDHYACTECGRCNVFCPTATTGKPLQPKKLILDIRDHLLAKGKVRARGAEALEEFKEDLILDAVSEDAVWDCTTCGACVEACPVFIEHVDKIVDMRRNLVLMRGSMEKEATQVFKNWETHSNPWGIGSIKREEWAKELGVRFAYEHPGAEYLYYVGCAASFDKRNQAVATAFVKILQSAGVDFAILGKEEKCNGETARRLGNEYLAQMMIQECKESFEKHKIKKILATCPHCFNTFKNEYPDFGGNYEVIHHTEFILRLIKEGKIKLQKPISETVAYHDACYLGRYNNIYEEPRAIIRNIPELKLVEFERRCQNGFCCGAGGGRMWLEERRGSRINVNRVEEAVGLACMPDEIASACPYCLIMMDDGTKVSNHAEIQTRDIAELVLQSLKD